MLPRVTEQVYSRKGTWLRHANCLSRVQRKMWYPASLKWRRQSRMPSSFSLLVLQPSGSSSGLHSRHHSTISRHKPLESIIAMLGPAETPGSNRHMPNEP